MKNELAISVKNISKTFRIPHEKVTSLRGAFVRGVSPLWKRGARGDFSLNKKNSSPFEKGNNSSSPFGKGGTSASPLFKGGTQGGFQPAMKNSKPWTAFLLKSKKESFSGSLKEKSN